MKMTRSPSTAVVTNISPNHLDWHRDFNEYVAAKKRICASIPKDGLLVLNYDNDRTRAFAEDAGCRVRFFSRKNKDAFCYIDGDGIHCGGNCWLADGDIRLVGAHNRENYAAAIAATADLLADGALLSLAPGIRRRSAPNRVRRGEKRRPAFTIPPSTPVRHARQPHCVHSLAA